jgi:dGTPase
MLMPRARLEEAERRTLAPYATFADASRGRRHPEGEGRYRTAFQKDRDRVIHTSAFRRLEYKTQVFVNFQGDYYRTRLTHTLEVVQVARAIARALGLNEDLAETIALAHDLGHPPFGHAGERTLDRLAAGDGGFDHNRQSLRIVTEIERRYPAFPGLNLTEETLEGIAKHETEVDAAAEEAFGFDHDTRASLEAQVVNVADELAYNAHDLDDGLRSGHLMPHEVAEVPIVGALMARLGLDPLRFDNRARYALVRELLGATIEGTIAATHERIVAAGVAVPADVRAAPQPLVGPSPALAVEAGALKRFLYERLYRHHRQLRMTYKADLVLTRLFEAYASDLRMLPSEARAEADRLGAVRAVTDYLAGMTDRYAIDEYRRLFDPASLT